MKIVCDACQAKYSISDDKVQGKVFKIRCKKCSNIIVVRGGAGAAEPVAPTPEKETRVYDYGDEGGDQPPAGDESVWHVVINQDQVGPMTAAEVPQRFAAGEIDGETTRGGKASRMVAAVAGRHVRRVRRVGQHDPRGHGMGVLAPSRRCSVAATRRHDAQRSGDLFASASASSHTSD